MVSLDDVRKIIAAAMEPVHFFVPRSLLEWQHCPSEEIPWETYQGRLLDPAHTRTKQTFESWNVFGSQSLTRAAQPVLSVKLDAGNGLVHVVRALECYAWEGYHAGDNVYLSRETQKWVRELVGTIQLDRFPTGNALRGEIASLLFQAVVGCSRLPLQSVEAPLPDFSLGNLAYIHCWEVDPRPPYSGPMRSFADLIEVGLHARLSALETAKLLESLLRSTPAQELNAAAELFMGRWRVLGYSTAEFMNLCRTLFNEVSLSPYTDFIDKTLIFLGALERQGEITPGVYADFLGYMLRQNVRHLTAYDLITFHHRGANYPDALLLDSVLKAYLSLSEDQPELFLPAREENPQLERAKRIRRRALRQAWLVRRIYEGLLVPIAPTSPGENARVLPPPFPRIPDEQIFQPDKRTKRLFEGDSLLIPGERSRQVMQQCQSDLQYPRELQELGMAVFLDRPFGVFKPAAEPDRTLLLSYEAFSFSITERRLEALAKDPALKISKKALANYGNILRTMSSVQGLPIVSAGKARRPAAVTLGDAARAAADFIVLRTTRQAVRDLLGQFEWAAVFEKFSLDYLDASKRVLIVSAAATRFGAEGAVDIYDAKLRRRLELQVDPSEGYRTRAGHEYPTAGLQVRCLDADRRAVDRERVILRPRE